MVGTALDAPPNVGLALFDLNLERSGLQRCAGLLDQRERSHAASFRFARDRDRFVARRGQLREHLADKTGADPRTLRIVPNRHGKPALMDYPNLAFSLSHSKGVALCATSSRPIGCDLEWRNPDLASVAVAERLFAPTEVTALKALPAEQWVAGFFNCWTRKEAYVKALGLGLAYPLDAFEVTVAPGEPARFLMPEAGWTLISIEPTPGYQAAVVTWAGG